MEEEDNNKNNEIEEEEEEHSSTGSPTAGEAGFVHVEQPIITVDSPPSSPDMDMDGNSNTSANSINQDDGVVITNVDTIQSDSSDPQMAEDGGNEEFVDCPDDLVSIDGRTDVDESSEAELGFEGQPIFGDATEDSRRTLFNSEKEILPNHYQEERQQLMTELSTLHQQLKGLIKKPQLIDGSDGGLFTGELTPALPLHVMVNECSSFIELAISEQSQTEGTIKDLHATIDMKDKEIEDLNVKVIELSSVETIADRISSYFVTIFGEEKLPDTSVSGKVSHLEKNTSILIEYYNRFLYEVEMLNQCLTEVKPDYQIEPDMGKVFFSVREEMISLKRKEYELAHKSSYLEFEYAKVMEQLAKSRETVEMLNTENGKLKGEVEMQKTRVSSTKEKLNLAVTKGKSLVQQRDSLKQVITDKTNELDNCLRELQEKSSALEAANSLKEALLQRDTVLKKCEEVLSSSGVGEEFQELAFIDRVTWLANESVRLHDENSRTKEVARAEIDRLTVSLVVEAQEKNYLQEDRLELDKCLSKIANISEELRVVKDKNGSLQVDLQRSEDKAALLREKLSMAVKKGKGLVQERESLKQQMAEKTTQIEELKTELKQQEERDVGRLKQQEERDMERIAKLEADLLRVIKERDQIEQFLTESNTMLQRVIEATEEITLPGDVTDPVEKVKACAVCLNDCQVAKARAEQELGDVKDESGKLASKLTDAMTTVKSLEDALLVSEQHVSQLTEEKREFEVIRANTEEELKKAMEEVSTHSTNLDKAYISMKSLEDTLSISKQHVSQLTEEKRELEIAKTNTEEELRKAMEEVSTHATNLNKAYINMKSLGDALLVSEQHAFQLTEEKRELEILKTKTEEELSKAMEEVSTHANNLSEAHISIKSLEDALSVSEQHVSQLTEEKRELEITKTNTEEELRKAMEEVSTHASNLNKAHVTIKSLEDAKSRLQTHVSQFSNENEKAVDDRSLLEKEIEKLKEEAAYHEHKFLDASATIKSLEDGVLKAEKTISGLVGEKKNAEQEISYLNTELSACRQELASKHENYPFDISSFLDNLQVLSKDGTLLTLFKESVEKKVEIFMEMDHRLKDIKDYLDSDQLQDYPAVEGSFQLTIPAPSEFENVLNMDTTDDNAVDAEDIGSYAGKTLEKLNLRNQILADEFGRFSSFIDKLTASLSRKLEVIRTSVPVMVEQTKTLQKNVNSLQIDKQAQEERVVMLELDLRKLRSEVEKTRSMYDKTKEENQMFQNRVFEVEVELEASQKLCEEMRIQLEDGHAKEDEWNKREAELSRQITAFMNDKEAENELLSASEVKSLFNKINGITIPFPNVGEGKIETHDLDSINKLFYIVENVNELLDQITVLSDSREELRSTLSKQALEIDHLKEDLEESLTDKKEFEKMEKELIELSTGIERILGTFGGGEYGSVGSQKSFDVSGKLPVLESLIHNIVLEIENSKNKLLETQKVAEELAKKVRLLEEFNQNRASVSDTIHERSGSESSSLPPRSEISEVEDPGLIGKRAAHVRSLRKGSNDQFSIDIDPESERLVDKQETVEDKGHVFKSLHTSGLVPAQGKVIADRLDGIWVSGGRALMSRPRARLGLIAYWLVLHLWLLGTLL